MEGKMAIVLFAAIGASRAVDIVKKIESNVPAHGFDQYCQPRAGKRKAQWKEEMSPLGKRK